MIHGVHVSYGLTILWPITCYSQKSHRRGRLAALRGLVPLVGKHAYPSAYSSEYISRIKTSRVNIQGRVGPAEGRKVRGGLMPRSEVGHGSVKPRSCDYSIEKTIKEQSHVSVSIIVTEVNVQDEVVT